MPLDRASKRALGFVALFQFLPCHVLSGLPCGPGIGRGSFGRNLRKVIPDQNEDRSLGDHPSSNNASDASEPPILPLWPWCVYKIKREFQQRKTECENETAQDRLSRRTTTATIVIAGAAIITAIISGLQYLTFHDQLTVMQGQLTEMKSGSAQTDRLIAANEKLANATAEMAATAQKNLEAEAAREGRSLRAQIQILQADLDNFEVGGRPVVIIHVANAGQGMARGKMRAVVLVRPINENHFAIPKDAILADVTVMPGFDFPRLAQGSEQLTDVQQRSVNDGSAAIFVFGNYRFTDESRAVTNCTYRLFYKGAGGFHSDAQKRTLTPTADYNSCEEESRPHAR